MKFNYPEDGYGEVNVVQMGKPFRLLKSFRFVRHKSRKDGFADVYREISLKSSCLLPPFSITVKAIENSDDYWEKAQYLIAPYAKQTIKQPVTIAEREAYVKKLQGGQVSQRQVAQQSPYELLVLNEYTDFCKNSIARNPQLKGQRGSAWRPTFKTESVPPTVFSDIKGEWWYSLISPVEPIYLVQLIPLTSLLHKIKNRLLLRRHTKFCVMAHSRKAPRPGLDRV